jgi:polyphenol oxidase
MNPVDPALSADDSKLLSSLTFPCLTAVPELVHGVFDRHGGVSLPPYDSLNVAWSNGDQESAVCQNLTRVKEALGFIDLVAAPQVHGDNIVIIDRETLPPLAPHVPARITPAADALISRLPGVGLIIKVADCQAVFVVDPVRQVVANVHCGWRGSVQGILGKVVDSMVTRFESRPADLLAAISPSLGPCCAEFCNYSQELPASFLPFRIGNNHFDFWTISRRQLEEAGLRPEHIEIANRCTVCDSDRFFSYRSAKVTGRMAAVVGWRGSGR